MANGKETSWILDQCEKERLILRGELSHLKTCQLTYITFSVTATGLILGVSRVGLSGDGGTGYLAEAGILFCIPLVILLPFWWTF